jgi:hypothetical protein
VTLTRFSLTDLKIDAYSCDLSTSKRILFAGIVHGDIKK